MVYTELAPRRQHFTWHQPRNNQRTQTNYITSVDRRYEKKKTEERIQLLIQNHMRHVRSESAREQRIALYKKYE